MVAGLAWTVLGLLGVVAAVLAVPIDLTARFDLGARTGSSLRIAWLFGLIRFSPGSRAETPTKPKKSKARKRKRRARAPSFAVIRRGLVLLGALLRRVRIRHASLDLLVGADDPAATGELAGFAAPVVALANALPRTRVTFTPDFAGANVAVAGEGEIRVVPITWIPPIVRFVLSPEVRQWLVTRRDAG